MSKQTHEKHFSSNSRPNPGAHFPKLTYDPAKRRSNIFEIERMLDNYVQQHYSTLYDCISTRKLVPIPRPEFPISLISSVSATSSASSGSSGSGALSSSRSRSASKPTASSAPSSAQLQSAHPSSPTSSAKKGPDDEFAFDSDDEHPNSQAMQSDEDYFSSLPRELFVKKFDIDYQLYVERLQLRSDELSSLYGLLKGIISFESSDKVKSHRDFAQAKDTRNGFILWMILYSTHQVSNLYLDQAQQRVEASRRFHSLSQLPHQSLDSFYEMFKNALKTMKELGCTLPTNADVVTNFMTGLCNIRFRELKHQFANTSNCWRLAKPSTLSDAYALACSFIPLSAVNSGKQIDRTVLSTDFSAQKKKGKGRTTSSKPPVSQEQKSAISPAPEKKVRFCNYCKRTNHNEDRCYKKSRDLKNKADADVLIAAENISGYPDFALEEFEVNMIDADSASNMYEALYQSDSDDGTVASLPLSKVCIDTFSSKTLLLSSNSPGVVLLDTCAQVSVSNDLSLLVDVHEAKDSITISGINKRTQPAISNLVGHYRGLKHVKVYFSSDVKRNILSFDQIESAYEVTWNKKQKLFKVQGDDEMLLFSKISKVYGRYFGPAEILTTTVRDNITKFSKRDVSQATLAREVSRRLGYESDYSLCEAIKRGTITNLPITVKDVSNAKEIFGPDIAALKGKSTAHKVLNQNPLEVEKLLEKQITLSIDFFYVDSDAYLGAISDPMNYLHAVFIGAIKGKSPAAKALTSIILEYRSEGYHVHTVISDNESSMVALQPVIASLSAKHVTGGIKSNTIPKLDRGVRTLKERTRSILLGLKHDWPAPLLRYTVNYACYCINLLNHSARGYNSLSPRELLTGIKCDFNRDLRIAHAQYAQVNLNQTDNSMCERTLGCLALGPTGNRNGSVRFLHLKTGKTVIADKWTELPMPDTVIEFLNSQSAKSSKAPTRDPVFNFRGRVLQDMPVSVPEPSPMQSKLDQYSNVMHLPMPEALSADIRRGDPLPSLDVTQPLFTATDPISDTFADASPDLIQDLNVSPDQLAVTFSPMIDPSPFSLATDPESPSPTAEPIIEPALPPNSTENPDSQSRTRRNPKPNLRYTQDYEVDAIAIDEAIRDHPDLCLAAIREEFQQLEDIGAYQPVHRADATKPVIPSKMIVKKKLDSNGNMIKVKARLCAGGHRQSRVDANPSSSPAALKSTVILLCAVAASREHEVATADVKGAFLHAKMKYDVYMSIDAKLSEILVALFPKYRPFVEEGKITVKLEKALYGCMESALLWYEEVSSYLTSIGFAKSEEDDCLFVRGHGDDEITVVLYIDDFFCSALKLASIKDLEANLKNKYGEVTFKYGPIHEYLGMSIDFSTRHQVTLKMTNKIAQLIKDFNIPECKTVTTPYSPNLMHSRELPLLPADEQSKMRSAVAKLLYLSLNTRPDICLPVNYLCTRVQHFNADDKSKFLRILYYLNGTINLGLTLICNDPCPAIHIYADAAYAINPDDRKSQTGICVRLGNATLLCRSGRQKINTKSSTEAELVACADSISYGLSVKRILDSLKFSHSGVVVHQDNLSTIKLIVNNKSTSQRTLHIDSRYFFLRDRNLNGQLCFEYTPTELMIADILTKPAGAAQFLPLRSLMLNEDEQL